MASKRLGVYRHGTAADADNAPGYSASGASEHTRHSAHGSTSQVKEPTAVRGTVRQDGREHGRGVRTLAQTIRETRLRISKIAAKLKTERDPDRLAKLQKDHAIKTAILANLLSGSTAKIKVRLEPIETIPGADEFDPWNKV